MPELYIGLMSGTSMDGIDAALVDFADNKIKLLASHSHNLPNDLKETLNQLCQDTSDSSIDMLGEADSELGLIFSEAVSELLNKACIKAEQITAIGSHGQTIRHRPDLKNSFSLQIGDANRISYNTGITTVSDFRRKDMAAGGEGAPLAPAFHQQVFHSTTENRAVLNIGGISNITYLSAGTTENCLGFDTGPGNTLMDAWIQKHQNTAYDKNGEWAGSVQANEKLVEQLMQDTFIHSPAPKSTGREHYNLHWLNQQLTRHDNLSPAQVQASLSQFTCDSIVYAIQHHIGEINSLIVCGGGVYNNHLMAQLTAKLANINVQSSEKFGVAPDWVEAIAFAWLARQTMKNLPGNIPKVTGADKEVILGAIYPA